MPKFQKTPSVPRAVFEQHAEIISGRATSAA
jgi:hypothetical protein